MNKSLATAACAGLVWSLPANASTTEGGVTGASSGQCRYVVAYDAPQSCPDEASLERRLGPGFRIERKPLDDCPTCVRGVTITTEDADVYRLQLGGLEATTVSRTSCEELVDLAAYTIEASDLPAPDCGGPIGRIGVATTPLVNLSNRDPMLLASLRATLTLGQWWFAPSGVWLLPTQVNNRVSGTIAPQVALSGYGAGLDVCRAVESHVYLCGAGSWRRVNGVLSAGDWAPAASDVWALGGGVSLDWPLFDALHVEIAPTVMAVLGEPRLTEAASSRPLYTYAGLEAQLRVGFSWEFGANSTPINTAGVRTAALHVAPKPAVAPALWF